MRDTNPNDYVWLCAGNEVPAHCSLLTTTHLGEDPLVGLLEEGRVEAVPHDHVAAGEVAAGPHLQQARLVQCTRVQI